MTTITGRVEYFRAGPGSRWLLTLGLSEPGGGIGDHQLAVLGPDENHGAVRFDGDAVTSGGDLVRRLMDAAGSVTVTIHSDDGSYIPNSRAEFVTTPYPKGTS